MGLFSEFWESETGSPISALRKNLKRQREKESVLSNSNRSDTTDSRKNKREKQEDSLSSDDDDEDSSSDSDDSSDDCSDSDDDSDNSDSDHDSSDTDKESIIDFTLDEFGLISDPTSMRKEGSNSNSKRKL